ncbi:MAG: hypothetical protein HZB42_04000 [Sphingobacteriales bacterium]|nr:hypothetical protein [Sphingobacteriales bacterium]
MLLSLPFRLWRALFGTPRSFTAGEKFERYARKYLFSNSRYDLLQKTHGYKTKDKNFVLSADPDFQFRDRRSGRIFYVEAKYRSAFFKDQVTWCTEKQLSHYQQRNREWPVFVLLGAGGRPEQPAFVSLIPLRSASFTSLFLSHARKYSIHPRRPVLSKTLWKR